MKKSSQLINIVIIIKFLLKEVFRSFFNNKFLNSNTNRIAFIILFGVSYLLYIYINMSQINNFNSSSDIGMSKQLISSFTNITIVSSALIYLFIDVTFSLSSRSLFLLKCLPFNLKEIKISKTIFKLILGMIIYELIITVALPLFTLTNISIFQFIMLFVTIHLIMIGGFLLLEFIVHNFLLKFIPNLWGHLIYICSIISISIFYFVYMRIKIDFWVYQSSFSVNTFLLVLFILSILILIFNFVALYKFTESDNSYMLKNYLKFDFGIKHKYLSIFFLAITRQKKLVYILLLVILFMVFIYIYFGFTQSMQVLYFLYPSIFVVGIFYASSTYNTRKMFNLYNITVLEEFIILLMSKITLIVPMFILQLIIDVPMQYIYIAFLLINLTIISGFLFPAFESSINESTASLLAFFLLIIISLVLKKPQILFLVSLIILGIEYICIYKERGDLK
ncbi:hypothetical protein ACWEVE_13140 [Staphylococcus xylosus]